MMDISGLTEKSQEALASAQSHAVERGHGDVDAEHLILALLDQPDGLAPRLLERANVDPSLLRTEMESRLGRKPRITGPGATPEQVHVTRQLGRALERAFDEARRDPARAARAPGGPSRH
jgi:ATP-dependent Clp protease ATP-binding subunit ClpB